MLFKFLVKQNQYTITFRDYLHNNFSGYSFIVPIKDFIAPQKEFNMHSKLVWHFAC